MKIAVLDDYQNKALELADWSPITSKYEVTVFNNTLKDLNELITRLLPFDIICVMRERTPMTAELLENLPNLKLIVSTGSRNASIIHLVNRYNHIFYSINKKYFLFLNQ